MRGWRTYTHRSSTAGEQTGLCRLPSGWAWCSQTWTVRGEANLRTDITCRCQKTGCLAQEGRDFYLRADLVPPLLVLEVKAERDLGRHTFIALDVPCSIMKSLYFIIMCYFRHRAAWHSAFPVYFGVFNYIVNVPSNHKDWSYSSLSKFF